MSIVEGFTCSRSRPDPDLLMALRATGCPVQQIAERIEQSRASTYRWLVRYGIPRRAVTLRRGAQRTHGDRGPWLATSDLLALWQDRKPDIEYIAQLQRSPTVRYPRAAHHRRCPSNAPTGGGRLDRRPRWLRRNRCADTRSPSCARHPKWSTAELHGCKIVMSRRGEAPSLRAVAPDGGCGDSSFAVCDRVVGTGSGRAGAACPRLHRPAPRGDPRKDRAAGRGRLGEHRDRRAARRGGAAGLEVAQTVLRGGPTRPGRSSTGRSAAGFSPLSRWWESRRWPVSCRPSPECRCRGGAPGAGRGGGRPRNRGGGLGVHGAALAGRGRPQALAAPVVDLPAGSGLRGQGGPGAGSVRRDLAGRAVGRGRVRGVRGREDLDPGPVSLPPHAPAGQGSDDAGRA